MYSEAEDHLVNLDHCGSRELRRAYLAILLAVTGVGFKARACLKGEVREMQIRNRANAQPFAVSVNKTSLLFYLRRPVLDEQPGLAAEATRRFGDAVLSDRNSLDEVRVRIMTETAADDLATWLFGSNSTGRNGISP